MSRTLGLIAIGGFLLSIAFFVLAFLIAGDQLFTSSRPLAAIAPLVDGVDRKEWRWNGGDSLHVEAPMKLRYSQQGTPNVTVTGPADLLKRVKVGGGQIVAEGPRERDGRRLEAEVSGVPIRKFTVSGRQDLDLGHIDQDSLEVRIAGKGSVTGEGKGFEIEVTAVEPTGSETRVFANLGGEEVVAVFRERHQFKPGEKIRLRPDPQYVHLFDATTGKRLNA